MIPVIDHSERHEQNATYLPTPEQIASECAKIRAENDLVRQGKKPQPVVDDDCDAELEDEADRACSSQSEAQ